MRHQDIDARSLAMHRLIAEKIRRDPALLEIARARVERWQTQPDRADSRYVDEWARVLASGLAATLSVATEESERATTLRQASPFAGVLTETERLDFLASWRRQHSRHEAA
jgi:hypothetical protein